MESELETTLILLYLAVKLIFMYESKGFSSSVTPFFCTLFFNTFIFNFLLGKWTISEIFAISGFSEKSTFFEHWSIF